MNALYLDSIPCAPAATLPGAGATDLPSLLRRWRASLDCALREQRRERAVEAAYRGLPTHLRVDLGIDRRRA